MIWCQLFSTVCHKSTLMLRQHKHLHTWLFHTTVSRTVAVSVTSKLLPSQAWLFRWSFLWKVLQLLPHPCVQVALTAIVLCTAWGSPRSGELLISQLWNWESHHHPPNNLMKQLLIKCASLCWNRIQAVKVENHLSIQFSSSWYHQSCWQMYILTIVQKLRSPSCIN